MKQTEAILLAKEKTRQQVIASMGDAATKFMSSPLVQLLMFCVLVEMLQVIKFRDKPLISDMLGNLLQTTVIAGKTVEVLAQPVTQIVKTFA